MKTKILIVFLAALSRLLPHPPNFTPIGGISLFSGSSLGKIEMFFIPLCAMLLSDFLIGFHTTMLYVYVSFALITVVGSLILKTPTFPKLIGSSLISSIVFFLITNFGVWASTNLYPHTFTGLMESYTMGLPFFRNTMLGDLIYTFGLFYGFRYFSNVTSYARS